MQQFGGKPAKKSSSDSKRHFTVVMGGKEHGLYVSSTPSSAARKAVTKLCAANKSKKVEFSIREITQGSKKKTYGPYSGYIEKLKEPIELKGRVIKYKPVAKLIGKKGKKMVGGSNYLVVKCKKTEKDGVINKIDEILQKHKIVKDDAIKITFDHKELYDDTLNDNTLDDTKFKIEFINKYSLNSALLNLITLNLRKMKEVHYNIITDRA